VQLIVFPTHLFDVIASSTAHWNKKPNKTPKNPQGWVFKKTRVFFEPGDWLGAINTAPPNHGKFWHLSLVVSGWTWWQETTTKCLWQEASTYAEDKRAAFNCMQSLICSPRN